MPNDGPGFRDEGDALSPRRPQPLPPRVRENLVAAAARVPAGAPPTDPLGARRRRWLRRLVGWLARRFDSAADSHHAGASTDRHYADLLRRVEGNMLLREAGPSETPVPDLGRAVGQDAEGPAGGPSSPPPRRKDRPDLRVVK